MAPHSNDSVPVFQAFKTEDDKPLQKLPAQTCPETGYKCIFWQDVQDAFNGVDYVEGSSRVMFMVDRYGEVMLPLRIRRDRTITYRVIYRERKGQVPPALELQYLYHSWSEVSKNMVAEHARTAFPSWEFSGNVAYYRSKMLEQLVLMKEIGVEAKVNGKTESQILDDLQEFQKQVSEWEYQRAGKGVVSYPNSLAPSHFLALPADLRSWDDSDPTTQDFRIYFLCNVQLRESVQSSLPQHTHLSNHPGYNLIRPQEFFQIYGSCSLLFLKMVKLGFSAKKSVYPPLDTFEILWNFDPEVARNHITKDTIGPLIDKSISYLETLSLPPFRSEKWRESLKSDAIKDFLVVPENSNPLGGLDRYTAPGGSLYWTCSQHGRQWLPSGTWEALMDFVQGYGGHIDMQQATLSIELHSTQQADQFCVLLDNTKQRIDVTIKFGWSASHRDLENTVRKIADTKVEHLALDGVTHSMHPQGNIEYGKDLFYDHTNRSLGNGLLESVTVLNYPRPQEQITYFSSSRSSFTCRLHWRQQQRVEIGLWLRDLSNNKLEDFVNASVRNEREGLLEELQRQHDFMIKAGCETFFTLSMKQNNWHGEFDMQRGTLQALQVHDLSALEADYNTGLVTTVVPGALESLHTLTVEFCDLNIDQVIARTVQASLELQELNISLQESHALERAERILKIWQGRSSPLQMTLLEREKEGRGHIVAQVLVLGNPDSRLGSSTRGLLEVDFIPERSQGWKGSTCVKVNFLQWRSDHVSTP
ncbi:MAG: hypothetical protein BYD32DRAFT_436550 [Podila humilis]|nr:MAG: hypothetical protein BYD32DRAFT_436550 [Podila humilis]